MKRILLKIRYALIGVSPKEIFLVWVKRLLQSGLLYFYVIIAFFIFFRGVVPLQKFNSELVLNTHKNFDIFTKLNIENPCNTEQNTIKYERRNDFNASLNENSSTDNILLERKNSVLNEISIPIEKEIIDTQNTKSETTPHITGRNGRTYTIQEFNAMSAEELLVFYGVGKVTANAIVELREVRGGFRTFQELLDVKGIGPAKLKKIIGGGNEADGADK